LAINLIFAIQTKKFYTKSIMDFKNIIYINGKSGLFELAGNKSNGVIAKSIEDGSTQFYSSRIHQFTPLDSIEMYTMDNNVPLREIMRSAKEKLAAHPPVDQNSDSETLRKYFRIVLPNFDEEKVKISDIKKFIKWFAICKDMNLADDVAVATPASEAVAEVEETKVAATETEEKPAKKTARKKAVKEESTDTEAAPKEKKPRATKKKAE
jgi:hypothetical protein